MNGASVSPCTTRVTRMTMKVIRISSARYGSGDPSADANGRARAAASETMPRSPVHAIRAIDPRGGIGSRARTLGTKRGTIVAKGTHTSRVTIAAPAISSPWTARRGSSPAGTASVRAGSESPMRIKMTPFSTKMRRSQTALPCNRVAGLTLRLNPRRSSSPPATQASTADVCARSAADHAI